LTGHRASSEINSPVFELLNIFYKYSNIFTGQRASSEINSPVFELLNIFTVKDAGLIKNMT